MRERFFEQEKMDDKKAIQRELEASGINDPSEWRKALSPESEEEKKKRIEIDPQKFSGILTYLEGGSQISDRTMIERFSHSTDNAERLSLLHLMSLADAIQCVNKYAESPSAGKYLADRLGFYQKLIQGNATRKQHEQEWDDQQNKYVDVVKEYSIDASQVSPETLRLGVIRDLYYAAMQGTPEMGAVKIATKRINEDLAEQVRQKEAKGEDTRNITKKIRSVVEFRGYYSGVNDYSIGQYADIIELYKKCKEQTQKRFADQELDEKQLEHKAVLLMAKQLEGAYAYTGMLNTSASPYNPSFKEAVVAGQLGHKVMRQMRGMRNKIQETNLEHIERFIGKSGDNRYSREKKMLDDDVKSLTDYTSDNKSYDAWYWRIKKEDGTEEKIYGKEAAALMTQVKNEEALQRASGWHDRETERLTRKFEKSKSQIEKADLPEDEKALQLQSVIERHEKAMAALSVDYETETARLQSRTPEQLLADLEKRQVIVNECFEKRKSLAQKALDLHFRINHTGGDYDSKPMSGIIDWINYAPLGAIKRAHKMMRLGMSDETITEHSLADIIAGQRGATRADLKFVHDLVEKPNSRPTLSQMMKVGNILSVSGYEVSLQEVAELAQKNFYGMTGALKKYNLEQVKQFIDAGINLQSLTTVKEVTDKLGHNLSPQDVAEMASHNIEGIEDAFRLFDLDAVKTLLKNDVHLPVAVAVMNNTKHFGYELNIDQISNVAKNVSDVNDFTSALRGLPLEQVERLFTVGTPYQQFTKVRSALESHHLASDFNSSLVVAQKLVKNNEYDTLDKALQFYSLQEIDQILAKNVTLSGVLEVREALDSKSVTSNLSETIQFAKYGSQYNQGYYVGEAIDAFGIDNVRKIVAKGCQLDKALEVNNYMRGGGYSRSRDQLSARTIEEVLTKGGIEAIIAIAKGGNGVGVALKTIEAGFTVEEITKFPFLISPLVTKK